MFVTGLGTPEGHESTSSRAATSPEFALWNVTDLGYLAYAVAADLVNGTITGAEGETFTVKGLNDDQPYTIGTRTASSSSARPSCSTRTTSTSSSRQFGF